MEEGIPTEMPSTFEEAVSPFPHQLEREVQRRLAACDDLQISSLVVRRIAGGVCLEGVLEVEDDEDARPEVDRRAREVAGVDQVLNFLVLRGKETPPAKG